MKYLNTYFVASIFFIMCFFLKSAYCYIIDASTLTLKNGKKIILLGDRHDGFDVDANIQQQEKIFYELSKISEFVGPENIGMFFEDPCLYDASENSSDKFSHLITEEMKEGYKEIYIPFIGKSFKRKSTKFTSRIVIKCADENVIDRTLEMNELYTTWMYNIIPKLTLLDSTSILKRISLKSIDPRNTGKLYCLFSNAEQLTSEEFSRILNNINLENICSPLSLYFFQKMKIFEDNCTEDRFGDCHSLIKSTLSDNIEELKRDSNFLKKKNFRDLMPSRHKSFTDEDLQMSVNDYLSYILIAIKFSSIENLICQSFMPTVHLKSEPVRVYKRTR